MENYKNNIEKFCSFYVNDWHLVTMLLPYINKQINEKANIVTILENNLEENIQTLIKKLNLTHEEKILSLDWKRTNGIKYSEVENKIKNIESGNCLNIIFINGSKNNIDIINKNIDKALKSAKIKNAFIKIIDCFEVSEFNINMQEILNSHDKILNTSGEKEISDVFEGYA